jgi:hypothetical protein
MPRNASPHWSTSSFGTSADTSPLDLAMLSQHLSRCTGRRSVASALRCAAEALNNFVAPRLMSTLALVALVVVVTSLLT